jgi:hypothetical protein
VKVPEKPPSGLAFHTTPEKLTRLLEIGRDDFNAHYLHWDDLRFRNPPEGLTLEEWWFALKFHRTSGSRRVPLKDKSGNPFQFSVPDLVVDLLHQIDRGGRTFVQIPEQITNAAQRDQYLERFN